MIEISLALFSFLTGLILKMASISYQSRATPLMFNLFNAAICALKINTLPKMLSSRSTIMLVSIFYLATAPYFYFSSIISMILVNALIMSILSKKNDMKDQAKYNFLSRFGGFTGILLVPLYLKFAADYLLISRMIMSISLVIYFMAFIYEAPNIKQDEVIEDRNVLTILRNAHKYKPIIFSYLAFGIAGFFLSNITFITGSVTKAAIPCIALLCLSFRKHINMLVATTVFASIISFIFYKSLILFLISFVISALNIETKTYARRRYGDAMEPHVTAHVVNDLIWFTFHSIAVVYYLF